MLWRRIDPLRPPAGTVVAGNFDMGSPDYDKRRLGHVANIAGGPVYFISVCRKVFTVTHYLPIINFNVVSRFEPTGRGTYYVTHAGVHILATTFENAAFLADHLGIEWEDLCPAIEEIDASDVAMAMNKPYLRDN